MLDQIYSIGFVDCCCVVLLSFRVSDMQASFSCGVRNFVL